MLTKNSNLPVVVEGYLPNSLYQLSRIYVEDTMRPAEELRAAAFHIRLFVPEDCPNQEWKRAVRMARTYQLKDGNKFGLRTDRSHRNFMDRTYQDAYARIELGTTEFHKKVASGEVTEEQLRKAYLDESSEYDFKVVFENCPGYMHLKLKWKDMVDHAGHLLMFGPKNCKPRSYNKLFDKKKNLNYLHHIFLQFARETSGDMFASLLLSTAYRHRVNELNSTPEGVSERMELNLTGNKKGAEFLLRFDNHVKEKMEETLVTFQDISSPIVYIADLINFANEAWEYFPDQMAALAGMRNINNRNEKLLESKRLQIFINFLSHARQADPRRLVHWSLIESLASYGWGQARKSQDFMAYHGHTCSTDTRIRNIKRLTNKLLGKHIDVLVLESSLILVYDNYQIGQHRKFQSGGSSSRFLNGTHRLAVEFRPFDNKSFDDLRVELTYDGTQPLASPVGMPKLEVVDIKDPEEVSNAISGIDNFVPSTAPDFTGKRCQTFIDINDIAKNIHAIWRSIAPENVDPKNEDFVRFKVERMREVIRGNKEFVESARTFQEKVVGKWNVKVGDVTKTLMLGLCGLSEDSGKKCGAITLDLEYMAGILKEKDDGGWELADNWEERFILLFGDCKTGE